jgi:glucokinase
MSSSEEMRKIGARNEKSKGTFAMALDVGGTFLKSALISSTGRLVKRSFRQEAIDSQGSTEVIIEVFVRALKPNLRMAEELRLGISGMGIGMPGPFDFKRGVSLMKHKFGSVYGLNLRNVIVQRLNLKSSFPIWFENDAATFLRGEAWRGAAQGCRRIMGITLGTGLGSAFMTNDDIVEKGPGIPPQGIWCLPFKDGIVEDRISRRGILARYKEVARNEDAEGLDVKDIALKGFRHHDRISLRVFEELGTTLGLVLRPILTDFEADCLVLGGQISKSFPLFSKPLRKQLRDVSSLRKISPARLIDLSPLYGAAKLAFQSTANRLGTS